MSFEHVGILARIQQPQDNGSAMNFYPKPVKLQDCARHGVDSGAELFVVEGDSASRAVAAVCDQQFQAVLPMQGKPMNANKAKLKSIQRYELFQAVFAALGYSELEFCEEETALSAHPEDCRFSRVILLFDPDADGIHCGALMLMFFHRMFPALLKSGIICLVRAPLYRLELGVGREDEGGNDEPSAETASSGGDGSRFMYAYHDDQARKMMRELKDEQIAFKQQRYRGLASMGRETLLETCIAPKTRSLNRLRTEDALAAASVFG